jgi:hypothetical protein
MENKINITAWIGNFLRGKYDPSDLDTQIEAGWYDWFCKDSSLQKKTEKLGRKLLQIIKSKKFDTDKTYVFFKNNCPCAGSLYDDFRICDLETGDVLFTITPADGHTTDKGSASVWGKENEFKEPLIEGTWKDVLNFFLK